MAKIAPGVVTTAALLLRTGLQAGTFLLVARVFGPEDYGQFVAIVCIGILVAPMVTMGGEYVVLARISTGRATAAQIAGSALGVLLALSFPACGVALFYAMHAVAGLGDWRPTLLILLAEICFVPWLEIAWRAYQADERVLAMGALRVMPAFLKFVAASAFAAGSFEVTLGAWAFAYFLATAGGALLAALKVRLDFGTAAPTWSAIRATLRDGWPFAIYSLAERATSDVDKLILAATTLPRTVGMYGASYRIVELFVVPAVAALMSATPSLYRHGATGVVALGAQLRRLSGAMTCYGLLAAVVMIAASDLVAFVLGERYADCSAMVRALALLPLGYGLRTTLGIGLAALGRPLERMIVQVCVSCAAVLGCAVAIPRFGWIGAAQVSVALEFIAAAALAARLCFLVRRGSSAPVRA